MRTPHFWRLAQIDEQHFITACRHGLIHLTWGRTTIRFSREDFRQLAGLLERTTDILPPSSAHHGEMRVTCRLDEDCELQLGSLILLLSPDEFQDLVQAAHEAIRRLDKILASGVWDRKEPEDATPSSSEWIQRTPFSEN
jgi:hypothetical protein